MKYLIIFLIISSNSIPIFGQVYVNNQDVNSLKDIKYIEIKPVTDFTTRGKVKCLVSYGQFISLKNYGNNYLRESKNNSRDYKYFNSRVASLSWFDRQGWDLVQVIPETTGGESSNKNVIYLMKRKK